MVTKTILEQLQPIRFDMDEWIRLYKDKYPDPLGTGKGLTRFCHPEFDFEVLYTTPLLKTAIVEVVVRDSYDNQVKAVVPEDELEAVRIATVSSTAPLHLVDLTGSAMVAFRLHSGIVGNTDQRAGRAFSRDIHDVRPDVDGFLYPSRLVHNAVCVAVYDRAIAKLVAKTGKTLNEDLRVPGILQDLNIMRGSVNPDAVDENE